MFSGRVMLQPDNGRAQQLDAVLAEFGGECQSVGASSLVYEERGDSSPIQTQETPSSTSSRMVYWRIALAEEKTYSDHALAFGLHQSSSSMARRLCSRKFSSIMKNDFTSQLAFHLPHHVGTVPCRNRRSSDTCPCRRRTPRWCRSCIPSGQPTEGMIVAAVPPSECGILIPSVRASKPETIAGCWIGALTSSPRKARIQAMPSPRTMWSASSMCSTPGIAATCPPTTMVGLRREFAHDAAHLPHFADIDDDRGDADDVVALAQQFRFKGFAGGKVQHGGGRRDVLLDHQDAPGAVEHAQGERPLLARHLVVVQLHRVDLPAAEFVVLRVRSKDGAEQNASAGAFRMGGHFQEFQS